MIRYYRRGSAIRTAETRRYAFRLTRHGWRRCTPAQHRQAWKARDAANFSRAVGEAGEDTRARIVGALPGKVYPKREPGL